MSDVAIRVEGLSKAYRIAHQAQGAHRYRTLREDLVALARAPFSRRDGRPRRETIWALHDVSFEVKRGEVLGIIGRNGAGKSTLLKILARITRPTEGYADVLGRVGSLLEVGTGFHPELTGRENVFLSGAVLGMTRAEVRRKFDEIVDFAEIEKFLDTPVKRFSSGMYMRLAFAVAAHLEPEILLVDEVLAVGDAQFQKKCLGKMGDVARAGRTVLFVSHQMNTIQALCQRSLVLNHGGVVYEGSAGEAVDFYLSHATILNKGSNIGQRPDRTGTGVFRFEGVEFKDVQTARPLQTMLSGQPVRIEVWYSTHSDRSLRSVSVNISFWSSTGHFLFGCSNDAVGYALDDLDRSGVVTFTIPKWPLTAGHFYYNLYAEESYVIADWVKQAGSVNVELGDYYGTGRLPATAYQGVYVDYIFGQEIACEL
ncbi:MAG: ABC transporter ATP-binding protein [Anaerolineales bacterium]|nr:ABC transporter ATP-binding protein [Anaerolineales bacterium]